VETLDPDYAVDHMRGTVGFQIEVTRI